MSMWLAGKSVRIISDHLAITEALVAAGATLVVQGAADILVHIAAPPFVKLAHEISHAEWRGVIDSELDQRFVIANDFAKNCRARGVGGAVLFIGAPEQALGADHAAAAGGLGNLTKTLGVEWARDGIRVNSIFTSIKNSKALANLAAYLVSDYAAYVTGAVMGINGDDS